MGTAALVIIAGIVCGLHLAAGQCHHGWVQYQDSCYLYVPDAYTWFDATLTCNTLRAHLVEINSAGENNFVSGLLVMKNAHYSWIGLEDFGMERKYFWASTQEVPEFTNWKAGEPNNFQNSEDCGRIDITKQWLDMNCERAHYSFICEA